MKLAIIGLGVMGQGIAELAGSFGVSVHAIVRNAPPENFETFLNRRTERLFLKNERVKNENPELKYIPIKISQEISDLNETKPNLIIECIDEHIGNKVALLKKIKKTIVGNYVLATNTSSLSVNEIEETAALGDDFIGIHFMNPPRMVPLVEVIIGERTSSRSKEVATLLLNMMDRTFVEIKDYLGFVVNRLLIPMINEAARMIEQQICKKEDVDQIMKLGAGHPLGPLVLADLIGIDVCVDILRSIHARTNNEAYKPADLMVSMVSKGTVGRKSKQGFYKY